MAVQPVFAVLRRAAPRSALAILLFQLVAGAATTWALLLTTHALAELIAQGPNDERLRAALPTLLLLGLAQAIKLAMDAGTAVAKARLVPIVHRVAEQQLFRASLQVELAAFDDPAFYDQLHRARERGVMHMEGATECIVEAISASLIVVGSAAALFWLHPLLLPILLLALLPEGWAALSTARLQYAGMPKTIALTRQANMMAELATQRESAPEIRAHQAEAYVLAEHDKSADALQAHLIALGLAEAKSRTIGHVLSGIGLIATFVALGLLLRADWLQLAAAGTAVIAIRSAGAALGRLMLVINELFQKGLYIADYREFLDKCAQRRRPAGIREAPENPQLIELSHISFRYPGTEGRQALRDISLHVHAGQTIALVGENGSGKTTLAKLIAGLYQPDEGHIAWDGIDIRDIAPDSLADRVVMVLQEPVRWPKSARDNIRIGRHTREDPDDRALLEAAHQSRAREVIEALPRRWNTLLSRYFRDGQDLSGGQWQRLAVARGLYRDAPVVIWDEPTAPLDAKAEHAVYESLRKLAHERTVILITHRLASVRNADKIFFLDNGALIEQGRHQDLLAAEGRYAELYKLQAKLHAPEGVVDI